MSPFQRADSANRQSLYSADGDRNEVIIDDNELKSFDDPPKFKRQEGRFQGSNQKLFPGGINLGLADLEKLDDSDDEIDLRKFDVNMD